MPKSTRRIFVGNLGACITPSSVKKVKIARSLISALQVDKCCGPAKLPKIIRFSHTEKAEYSYCSAFLVELIGCMRRCSEVCSIELESAARYETSSMLLLSRANWAAGR